MIIWNLVFSLIDIIIMFNICKINPIWLPPCHGDVWEELNQACKEIADVLRTKFASSISDLSKAFNQLQKSLGE